MKTIATVLLFSLIGMFSSCQQNDIVPDENKIIELDEKSALLIEADNEFGLNVFQKIRAASEEENLMISPLSISLALAMTYNGAQGDTKKQMEEAMYLNGLTSDEINASYKMLVAALQSLDEDVVFEIANAIFYSSDFNVKQQFIDINTENYKAKVESMDFLNPATVDAINLWVKEKTRDKIQKIVENLSPDDRMVLLNAIYFNGIWTNKFKENGTTPQQFTKSDGSRIEVPMMNKEDQLEYTTNTLFSAVQLPYGTGRYNMIVFLPSGSNSSQDIIDNFSKENWKNWMNEFEPKEKVVVTMPRFKYEFKFKLNEVLKAMGMEKAFNAKQADFSGISESGDLYISSVMHKSYIDVNENGTEAAAVTSVIISTTSIDPDFDKKIFFTVNKPFVFAITEKDTNAILFIGEVRHPEYSE